MYEECSYILRTYESSYEESTQEEEEESTQEEEKEFTQVESDTATTQLGNYRGRGAEKNDEQPIFWECFKKRKNRNSCCVD
ncbi:hypothetical protein CEXT_519471 [Caerostris extrusa]|uniref:Uncharacterized protein n=1 Tax=Caerostris extrusa TaxID=172846 RepID=A0AAV4T5L3_CAEEX|nr:hypothetical protein CEXT_519471 [Caerostris extrusa]